MKKDGLEFEFIIVSDKIGDWIIFKLYHHFLINP